MSTWDHNQWLATASGTDDQWFSLVSGTEQFLYVPGMEATLPSFDGGFTTVFGNSTRLYLGTNGTGIKYINKDDIVGLDIENPPTLTGTLNDYLVPPYITGFNIRYIHCNDNYIGTVTEYGWDIIALKEHNNIIKEYFETETDGHKCFVTSDGYLYYTVSGTSYWELNKSGRAAQHWDTPSISYVTGGGILPTDIAITDIFVTEGTASNKLYNTIFCSTTSGVYIIDEYDNNYYVFTGGSSGEYNFNSVWADTDTSLVKGRVYTSSASYMAVIDMRRNNIYSYCTTDIAGRDGQVMSTTPIIDITKS